MTSISTIELGRVKLGRHVPLRSSARCRQGCRFKLRRPCAHCFGKLFLHTTMSMEGVTVGQGDLGGDAQGNACAEEEDTRVGFWISDNDSTLLIIQDC
jgi:hypothetical protein